MSFYGGGPFAPLIRETLCDPGKRRSHEPLVSSRTDDGRAAVSRIGPCSFSFQHVWLPAASRPKMVERGRRGTGMGHVRARALPAVDRRRLSRLSRRPGFTVLTRSQGRRRHRPRQRLSGDCGMEFTSRWPQLRASGSDQKSDLNWQGEGVNSIQATQNVQWPSRTLLHGFGGARGLQKPTCPHTVIQERLPASAVRK